ncbi:hypothetical protein [Elizabethkingia anophelis]|uniref:hypothetical protein n=1 Tax=Elizabethkingia anophelis TaxID=1117645 RepID=UPI0021A6D686|nr:hypothetical protein [Elizabethkingia anophelis]MCT4299310.1 hypothetical protein [Elizabethkingia anophelis]MDV3741058.1 hypothetical protein [Elizabethkingia anophelis]MDV3753987.1 hypothetical protein [Elizabethkingia anophelis]MDV3758096.1 hypothetical protein [Elizabethkingia anophelis]
MIEQIKKDYRSFSDAVIQGFNYFNKTDINSCEIYINLYNWTTNNRENIILLFENILLFKFFESIKINSTVISNALLKEENGIITFDFFPVYFNESRIEENKDSDFIIKSEKLEIIKK